MIEKRKNSISLGSKFLLAFFILGLLYVTFTLIAVSIHPLNANVSYLENLKDVKSGCPGILGKSG